MYKSLFVLFALALFLVACSDNDGTGTELFSSLPSASGLSATENPSGLSPTEYIIAHNLEISIPEELLADGRTFIPDTIFASAYVVSDKTGCNHTVTRTINMPDGTSDTKIFDFSDLHGEFILIHEDNSLGYLRIE